MSNEQEQEQTVSHRDAIIKNDIAAHKSDERERWFQDVLEDDDVREVLKCRNVPSPKLLKQNAVRRDAIVKKDIVAHKSNERERWFQDMLEDDDVREVLKSRNVQKPKLLKQNMRPVILVLAIAVPLLSLAPVAFAADAVSKFDIAKNCKAEVADAGGVGETLASCTKDEEDARHQLIERWDQFAKEDKSVCINETSLDGTPSYVELQTCLEIAADNKARLGK